VLNPLHDLFNCLQKICGILTVGYVGRVAPRGYPAVDQGELRPKYPVLSQLVEALGQAQEYLQMMRKDSRMLGKDTALLEFIFKGTQCPTTVHSHKLGFEEAFNSISSHIHRTTPPPGVEQGTSVAQAM
jgi:hypothetical protein